MDSSDYDSQTDIFSLQVSTKLKTISSAPSYTGPKKLDYVYRWLILFKWGGDVENPFELMSVEHLQEGDIDPSFLTGILSPLSRMKHRNIGHFPDFAISIFGKVEESKVLQP